MTFIEEQSYFTLFLGAEPTDDFTHPDKENTVKVIDPFYGYKESEFINLIERFGVITEKHEGDLICYFNDADKTKMEIYYKLSEIDPRKIR